MVDKLHEMFKASGIFMFYLRGDELNEPITFLAEDIKDQLFDNKLAKWLPANRRTGTRIFIQSGQNQARPAEERPKFELGAKLSFHSFSEYIIVHGIGILQEHEIRQQDLDTFHDQPEYQLRCMAIPDAGDRRYLGFLDISEMNTANLRLQPGDRLSLNFDPVFNDAADDWSAFVVDPLPFAPHSDVTLIFTRPWDKTEKN